MADACLLFVLIMVAMVATIVAYQLYRENQVLIQQVGEWEAAYNGLVEENQLDALRRRSRSAKLKTGQVWCDSPHFDPLGWPPTVSVRVEERLIPDTKGRSPVLHYRHVLDGVQNGERFTELDTGASVFSMSEKEWELTFPYLLGEEVAG